jgi:hypothetical protein
MVRKFPEFLCRVPIQLHKSCTTVQTPMIIFACSGSRGPLT